MTNSSSSKKYLVSGGAGFIGSHLCARLLADGHEVICTDDLYTGTEENIQPFRDNPKFEFVLHDITVPLFPKADRIFNLACPASPVHYQSDPIKTLKTNVMGTLNMLGVAKRTKAPIVQASTSEVYGDPALHPQPESYWGNVNPIGVRSCYDEGKRAAEALVMDYRREHEVDGKIIRIFNTYGPNMRADDGRVVSNFIVQALRGDDLTIYGDGSQTRSFCYIDDMVEIFVRLMEKENFAGPVNAGNPGEFTVLSLAEKVLDLVGSSSKLVRKPLPQDDPTRRKPDISLAKKELDWEPKVQLEEGLKKTIKYFDDWLSKQKTA